MRAKFQLIHALVLAAISSIALVLGMLGLQSIGVENLSNFNTQFFIYFPIYSLICLFVIVYGLLLKPANLKISQLGWSLKNLPKNILFGILGFVGISLALYLVMFFLNVLDWEQIKNQQAHYDWKMRAGFLLIGIHAAFLEESVFRGYLQKILVDRFGKTIGIVAGSIIFSLYHLNFNPIGLIGKFIIGVGYGVLFQKNKSLIPSAIAHILFWVAWGTI
jgi:membrane protease YdiL (CAAX protease family)